MASGAGRWTARNGGDILAELENLCCLHFSDGLETALSDDIE
jgi:hypothetical protein